MADAGLVALVVAGLAVTPRDRERVRARSTSAADLPFVEVYVDTPLEECERARPQGPVRAAPARARCTGLTGIDDPYEPPEDPDLVLDGTKPIADGVAALEALLEERGLR